MGIGGWRGSSSNGSSFGVGKCFGYFCISYLKFVISYPKETAVLSLKLVSIQRNSRQESRFHPEMGHLIVQVTRIQKTILGIPFQTLHKYRETYFGKVKDCSACKVSRMEPAF